MMLESIEKLRESSHLDDNKWTLETGEVISMFGSDPKDPNAVNWGEQWRKIADEIEAEIAERYMQLPVDAEGVPIHCGERMRLDNGHEGDVWLIGVFDIMMSDHTCFDWAKSHHVKPRTVEDVLRDVWKEALDYAKSDMWRSPDEVFAERAGEIRDLLGGDAE